jgi:Cdc6-like AAA superfamily ATPase
MKVYIAMNGSSGCMPDNAEVYTSYKSACDMLISMLEIEHTDYAEELRKKGIVYFDDETAQIIGAQYAEIATDNMTKKEIERYNR